jgi:hypothetical protein
MVVDLPRRVTLDMPEIVDILNALDDERFDEVIALAEKVRARRRMARFAPASYLAKLEA